MKLKHLVESDKNQERIDRQEKFAAENFVGLEDIGERIKDTIQYANDQWKAIQKGKSATDKDYQNEYRELENEIESRLSIDMVVLSVKMSNVVGHALNANSTKIVKQLIEFMDKYGIGQKPIHTNLMQIASSRKKSGELPDMALMVAAKTDDVEFAKYVFDFVERNNNRKNIFEDTIGFYDFKQYGYMQDMSKIRQKEDIAFEALVHGSKKMYDFLTDGKGLSPEYITKYIIKDSSWYVTKLSKKEVANVLTLEPQYVEDILEHMPENLPQTILDIFIF